MVTDGADTTDARLTDALLALKAGTSRSSPSASARSRSHKDIQIGRVDVPRSALKGTSLHRRRASTQTRLRRRDRHARRRGRRAHRGPAGRALPADGEPAAVRVRFTASNPVRGFRLQDRARARRDGDAEQRARGADRRRDRAERILYFEGEPRFELKFIRRAVQDDKNLRLVALQRTADNKYLRLGVDDAGPSARRVPQDARGAVRLPRPDPRQHRGRRLHRRSAAHDRRLRREARRRPAHARRPRAFAEGSYAGTPVAEVLPVILERRPRRSTLARSRD